ncbi:acyltransferase family protein [Aliamphritea ceti]|uniref:acyltransferase family protein n=1 Tax=Aliamphritea ceti TaxID=1524258 RepID=UPI0021C49034|nr:acyltransferase [Aliamphritea ceti]
MIGQRFTELDGLRGIAAVAVVFYHYLVRYVELYGGDNVVSIDLFWLSYGVQLFFAISGFVIFYSIEKKGVGAEFIVARFARLYPGYLFAVFLTFSIVGAFGLEGRERSVLDLIKNLIIFHSYFGIASIDGVYWTLSYEVVFYGLVFVLAISLKSISLYRKVVFIYLCSSIFILIAGNDYIVSKMLNKTFILDYLSFFIMGMYFCQRVNDENKSDILGMIIILFLMYLKGENWVVFAVVFLIFQMLMNGWLKVLKNNFFCYLGMISYSLYLLHQNIGYVIINLFVDDFGLVLAIMMAIMVSLILATISYYFVERVGKKIVLNQYNKFLTSSFMINKS